MSSSRSGPNSPVLLTISGVDGGSIVGGVPARRHFLEVALPWYWTDDLARALLEEGRISESVASELISLPVAYRSEESTVEAAASALLEDDEIASLAHAA